MIGGILLAALTLALWGAWRRNKGSVRDNGAAWALAASAATTSALSLMGAPFDFGLWIAIDIGVIAAVCHGKRKSEQPIVPLMILCWLLYQLRENGVAGADAAIWLIVSAQLLLTVPWGRLVQPNWTERAA